MARAPTEPEPLTERLTDVAPSPLDGPESCVIHVLTGHANDQGRSYTLQRGTALIGTAQGCDVCVSDPKVSRRHLEVSLTPQGVALRDLGSTNGTRYLGAPITEAVVPLGSQVVLGRTVLAILPVLAGDTQLISDSTQYGELVGASPAMRQLFGVLQRLERTRISVLIQGDTGTGKELVARALHEQGPNKEGPFVVVDCGAIPQELAESEIFGHVRGAFTGALNDRVGAVEQAHGGSLFLDEIGELPLELQTRLLRVLDRHELKRVGENRYRNVDVRILAATRRDLVAEVKAQRFREDLYYRLAVVTLRTPPLQERGEDIVLLAQRFAREQGATADLPEPLLRMLRQHTWPGNVRELKNSVARLLALGTLSLTNEVLGSSVSQALEVDPSVPYKQAREELLDRFELAYLDALMARNNGVVAAAAREAQVSRKHLTELLQKHGRRGKSE